MSGPMGTSPSSLGTAALDLAVEQPLLPLEPAGKKPLGRLGIRSATQDAETIARWWSRWPTANLGMRCDGLAVVDVDGPTGERSLARLEQKLGPLPASRAAKTGKGRHLYFRSPTLVGNSTAPLGAPEGIDLRGGSRGYVVAPPSLHASGHRYEWIDDRPPALLPDGWVGPLTAITRVPLADQNGFDAQNGFDQTGYGLRALESELERLLRAPSGRRNEELNRSTFRLAQLVAGGQLRRETLERAVTEAALLIGLEPNEIRGTIRSAIRGGARFPRLPRTYARARGISVVSMDTGESSINPDNRIRGLSG